jgi:hypothetical protein
MSNEQIKTLADLEKHFHELECVKLWMSTFNAVVQGCAANSLGGRGLAGWVAEAKQVADKLHGKLELDGTDLTGHLK